MPVFGIVRVGFQNNPAANNAARDALTGTITAGDPEHPFRKKNTGLYIVDNGNRHQVAIALDSLMNVLVLHSEMIDMISINLTVVDEPFAAAGDGAGPAPGQFNPDDVDDVDDDDGEGIGPSDLTTPSPAAGLDPGTGPASG